MAYSGKVWCNICELNVRDREAIVWCPQCFQSLCGECDLQHAVSRSSRSHTTLLIEEYVLLPKVLRETKPFCTQHDEPLTVYCPTHREPCCLTCMTCDHRFCASVTPIQEVTKNLNLDNATLQFEKKIEDMMEYLKNSRQERVESVEKFKSQIESYKSNMSRFRQQLIECFDKTEKETIERLEVALKTYTREMKKINGEMAVLEKSVRDMITSIEMTKKYATGVQVFLTYTDMEAAVLELEKSVVAMEKNTELQYLDLKAINDDDIERKLGYLSLDDLIKTSKKKNTKYVRSEEKQAQIPDIVATFNPTCRTSKPERTVLPPTIKEISLEEINSMAFHGYGNCNMVGCSMNRRGEIVFCDSGNNGRILIFNSKYCYDRIIRALRQSYDDPSSIPFAASFISDDKLAVTLPKEREVLLLADNASGTAIKRIELDGKCSGLDVTKDRIITTDNHYFYKMDFEGNVKDKFEIDDSDVETEDDDDDDDDDNDDGGVYQVVAVGRNIITSSDNIIYWLEADGTVIRKCTIPDVDEIRGIAVDTYGNIYVSGFGTDNIFVVSQDGSEYRLLLNKSDGLDNPTAMVYDKKQDRLIAIVASGSNARAVVYNVLREKK